MEDRLSQAISAFLSNAQRPMFLIVGPTASGKTDLSLEIAKRYNCEIISTDSRQIYRDMDIATDAILPEDTKGIPHHMVRIAAPDEVITLSDYVKITNEIIADIYARGRIPLLVGGTWLYISALTESYNLQPAPPNPQLRAELEKLASEEGNEAVHKKLQALDPQAAENIHPNNLRYVMRAIEINLATGSAKQNHTAPAPYDLLKIGIEWPREVIYERINQRVDRQVERGLLAEVQNLLDHNYDENLPSMTSLGVKEIIPHLKGEMPLDECLEILKRNTRHYAKRQLSWYRRFDDIIWLTPAERDQFLTSQNV